MDSPAALCVRFAILLFFCAPFVQAKDEAKDPRRSNVAAAAALFSNGVPLQIEIQINDADVKILKKDSRKYVKATVLETLPAATSTKGASNASSRSQIVYNNVGLHLKGSAG